MSQSILYFVLNVSDSIIFHLTCIFYCVVESTSKCNITHNICKTPALVLKSSIFPLVFY